MLESETQKYYWCIVSLAVFGMRSRSGQLKSWPKHTSKSEVSQNEGTERERRDQGWWNGERKSLDSDLWPDVFLFSFTLLFAPYVSFLILLTGSLCPALIWPRAVISVTFPGVISRPRRQRGQSAAPVHLPVNIRSLFGQHQWCVQDPEATKMAGGFHQRPCLVFQRVRLY